MLSYFNDLVLQAVSFKNVCTSFHLYHTTFEFFILIGGKLLIDILYQHS